ncbi:MAG: hypothetical protein AAFV72_23420 [Cyanobacteria bacterium J06635_1]
MNYLVAVLSDRIKAEEAYSALEAAKVPLKNVAILGKGYQSADEFGLIDPNEQAQKQMRLMAIWLVPFGFIAGFLFDSITGLNTFPWAGTLGNQIIGGFLGAASGALGSFFVGGGVGIAFGSGDALPYRNRLNAGQYLVVVKGPEGMISQSARILQPLRPENIQGYNAQ